VDCALKHNAWYTYGHAGKLQHHDRTARYFRGIQLDPLSPANFSYLLWMLMGYGLVVSVLVVTLGRIGDIFGRMRMYNLGFVIFSCASIALSAVWGTGASGALQIILFRIVQAIGGAMLMANSAAIITDAFPANERGMALGINQIAALGGSFLGLVIGGALASVHWRWGFPCQRSNWTSWDSVGLSQT